MVSGAFTQMATASASTKRQNSEKTGQEENLTGLVCVPVMPASLDLLEQLGIHSPREKFETYLDSQSHTDSSVVVDQVPDIENSDRMTVDGVVYVVTYVARWNDGSNNYIQVILDEVVAVE